MREHVVVRSNSLTGGSVLAVGAYGREGARQSFASNVDLRGHSLMGVRSIVFVDGTVIPAGAPSPDPGPVDPPPVDPPVDPDVITCVGLEASSYVSTPSLVSVSGVSGAISCSDCIMTDVRTTDVGPTSAQAANVAAVHQVCASFLSLLPTTYLVATPGAAPVATKMTTMLVVINLGNLVVKDSSPAKATINLNAYPPPAGTVVRTATCALALSPSYVTPGFASCLVCGPLNASGDGTVNFKITTNTSWEGVVYAHWTLTAW